MMHWALLLVAILGVAGVVWLLVERGARGARLASAEAEGRAERERREQVEGLLETRAAESKAANELVARAQAAIAGLEASLKSERAERENERLTGAKFEERLKTSFGSLAGEALSKWWRSKTTRSLNSPSVIWKAVWT